MLRSEARIPTSAAERYAKQLCNHATHMGARSDWAPPNGVVDFPQGGTCHVRADPMELILVVQADSPSQLATIRAILTADFQRFGHRDGMNVTWSS